jgi:CubicO group peptidase (beta-lactamase class C family)
MNTGRAAQLVAAGDLLGLGRGVRNVPRLRGSVGLPHATIRRVQSEQLIPAVRPFVDSGLVPGAVVGVRHRGETTVDSLGVTGPDGFDPLMVDAVVRISSNTKPLIAALTLLLAQDGVLALDDPVERFLPELADRRVLRRLDGRLDDTEPALRSITIEDLLTMRMGFGWVFESACPAVGRAIELELGFGPPDPQGPPLPGEWITRFATLPLLEQPSSVWRYELAFAVLGVLVVRADGRPLDVALRDRLLAPLGMTDTGFVAATERLVPAFERREEGLVLFDGVTDSRWAVPPRFPDGRGGLVSSVGDLVRFAGMLLDDGGGLLIPDLVSAMTTDQLTARQRTGASAATFLNAGGWGYGLGVTESAAGRRYGWGGGLGTLWYSWPEHDVAAILATQVLPPSAELFDAFTDAVESGLKG